MSKTEKDLSSLPEIDSNGFIDLEEFMPSGDTFVVQMLPVTTTKETETGIVLSIQDSVVHDRPNFGKIVSVGPECERKIGEYVYIQKGMGYDLEMIRKPSDVEAYVLLYNDAIIGNRIKKD